MINEKTPELRNFLDDDPNIGCLAKWEISCFIEDKEKKEPFIQAFTEHFSACTDCAWKLLDVFVGQYEQKHHLLSQNALAIAENIRGIDWKFINLHPLLRDMINPNTSTGHFNYKNISPNIVAFLISYALVSLRRIKKDCKTNTLEIFLENVELAPTIDAMETDFYLHVAKNILQDIDLHFHFQGKKITSGSNLPATGLIPIKTSYVYDNTFHEYFKPVFIAYFKTETPVIAIAEPQFCTLFFPE